MESSKKFIERLEKLRFKMRWTWAEVAKEIGLSRTMIHFIKKGKHTVSEKVLHRLEEAELQAGLTTPSDIAFDHLMNSPAATKILATGDQFKEIKSPPNIHSLATPTNMRAVARAFKFEDADPDELMSLFEKAISIADHAPTNLGKYFVLFRAAIAFELNRRMKKK